MRAGGVVRAWQLRPVRGFPPLALSPLNSLLAGWLPAPRSAPPPTRALFSYSPRSPHVWPTLSNSWSSSRRLVVSAKGGSSSYACQQCLPSLVPDDADLVLFEFALNDYASEDQAHEERRCAPLNLCAGVNGVGNGFAAESARNRVCALKRTPLRLSVVGQSSRHCCGHAVRAVLVDAGRGAPAAGGGQRQLTRSMRKFSVLNPIFFRRGYELLIRKLLVMPARPALLALHVYSPM